MSNEADRVREALQDLADAVTRKMAALARGEPEDQLRAPFEQFIERTGSALGFDVIAKGESHLPDRLGKPDYAILVGELLAGYAELKAPGTGARPRSFRGHDRAQWKRFSALPNVLYSDGNEWGIYRNGEAVGHVVRIDGNIGTDGAAAVTQDNANQLLFLLRNFFLWEPSVPGSVGQLAELLAPLCRALRDDVLESLKESNSPLVRLAEDWRQLLFPGASDEQFADAYAQTVTYALLLARAEGGSTLNVRDAVDELRSDHSLLSRALEVLTDPRARTDIDTSLQVLQRVVDRIEPTALQGGEHDPWLYFYEDFLGAYDPKLRKDAGVYYTPRQVVRAQVRLIDDILTNDFGLELGFANTDVITLDPGVGTGTYLLGVIEHAMQRVDDEEGPGSVPGRASAMADRIHGFEIMVGPYAVAELRVAQALERHGARLPAEGPNIYLTDTLAPPTAEPKAVPLFYEPLAEEHRRALRVKESEPILVCLGNPPYDRHSADEPGKGGWVRHRAAGEEKAILEDFLEPARKAGHGRHLKNLYNLYVYFWRWALWKVFEHDTARGPGVVSFITAASYLRGTAFAGMREHFRRQCDEIWIIDLGGEGRGTRQTENVFAIQTPVAIAVAVRYGEPSTQDAAKVHYAQVEGKREKKLQHLDATSGLGDLHWEECLTEWQAPFLPPGSGAFFSWPTLTDILPWRRSGVTIGRTWTVSPYLPILRERWKALLEATGESRRELFKDSPTGRKVDRTISPLLPGRERDPAITTLQEGADPPPIMRYGFRSFDRQWIIADARLIDRPSRPLWAVHSDRQVYMTSLINHSVGHGPAVSVSAHLPDKHHFRGSYGAKEVFPFWRDACAENPNLHPNLLQRLEELGVSTSPEDVFGYCYALLANPAYTERFFEELGVSDEEGESSPRIPFTKSRELFHRVSDLGRKLLHLHTFGERFSKSGSSGISPGAARCTVPVPSHPEDYPTIFSYDAELQSLAVGEGRFAPVEENVWEYQISGLQVVSSWLGYRMKSPSGRRSSPLDEMNPNSWPATFTTELLELLWVLERSVKLHGEQETVLDAVLAGPVLTTDELGPIPEQMREDPNWSASQVTLGLEGAE